MRLIELLPVAAAQLKVVFQREGKVDFTEIAHASARALGTRDNPTDLAFALDCKINHLLVDEFQDTSHSQFELLETTHGGMAARRWTDDVSRRRSHAVDLRLS